MKFMFAVPDFDMGGITASLKNLSDKLIKKGHRVSILRMKNETELPLPFDPDIEWINMPKPALKWNVGMHDFKAAHGVQKIRLLFLGILKKLLSRLNLWHKYIFSSLPVIDCDVAVAYRQSADCCYIVSHKTNAKRTIGFIHSELTGDTSSWLPSLKEIDRIACVSDDWSKDFCRRFPYYTDKVGTVYNLFDADDIRTKSMLFSPNYNKKVFNLVTVARIDSFQKKIETIPYIVDILRKKSNTKIQWYVVGDGSSKNLVKQAIKDTKTENVVHLLGAKANPYPYIKNADLFVLTSSWESYAMVIQEALILGTPVVAGEYGALKEIIKDPHEGIIAENSVKGIAYAILELVNNPKHLYDMKEYLSSYKYSSDVAYNQLMKLCQ